MIKKNRAECWLFIGSLILFGGMRTYAMEIGGFDVEIGTGENVSYPEGWWDMASSGSTEEHISENDPDEFIAEGAFEGAASGAPEVTENGSEEDFMTEQNVRQETSDQQDDLEQQTETGAFVRESVTKETDEVTEVPAMSEPTITSSPARMPSPTENLLPSPTATAHPANTITPTPEAEKRRHFPAAGLSEGAFPVSALMRILSGSPQIKLKTLYWKKAIHTSEIPRLFVQTEGGFHILSIRVNGLECSYHWEEDRIILEQDISNTENVIEVIALCQEGEKIRVWTE